MSRYNNSDPISLTPAIAAATYADGDVVGDLLRFNVGASGGGVIRKARVICRENLTPGLALHLFSGEPTEIASNAAFAQVDADLLLNQGNIAVASGDYAVYATARSLAVLDGLDFNYATTSEYLYGYLVADGEVTFAGADKLTVELLVWKD